jgi:signal transduction histidine kinase
MILLSRAAPACSQYDYIIHHYTNENGLPANGIKGIELDKKTGFLWVGTQAGLVRFDGTHFKRFVSAENKMPASRITIIAQNREGVLYCEDDNSSIYRIVKNQPQWVMADTSFQPRIFRAGSFPTMPAKQLVDNLKHHPRTAFLPNWVVFHDEQGDSSSFTFNYLGNACHYDAAKDSLLYFPHEHSVQTILKLDGRVYFVRENLEVWEYNDSLMKLLPVQVKGMPDWGERGEKPRYVWQPGMKEPLLVYKEAIWKLHRAGNSFYLETFCQGCCPPDPDINVAQIWEEQGIIFLGSVVNGLYVVRSPFLRVISTDTVNKNKPGKAEYAQAEITPGSITTPSGYTFSLQGKLLPRRTAMEFNAHTVYQNTEGDCWFHVKDTIIHYDVQGGRYTKMPVNDGAVKMMFGQTRNKLYVVSDIAIAEITGDRYQLLYEPPPAAYGLKNSLNPDAIIEWKQGVFAIAAEKLVLFDTEKRNILDTIPLPGVTAKVRSLMKYRDYLLIGTYGQGFYMYRNGIVKKMPLDKHQYLSYTHCFLQDANEFCWISTNHGLFKVSLDALIAAYENDLDEIYYQYFGKDDGILNTEFNGGCQPCGLKLSSGLYSFPTMNGLAVFDPLRQHTPPPAGQIFVDEVWVDTILTESNDNSFYELPYDLRSLRFSVSAPQFGNRENIYFSYKLEPYHDKWETQDIAQNNILQFNGLKPGDYKLFLRVRNGFTPYQFGMRMMEFRILKPWYQSWWFYLLCVFGFIAMTSALVKWRTARLIRRKKELQQMVAEKTRNIGAQSKQLEGQLHQLKSQQIRLEEDNRIKARLIAIISHDMLGPLKFMGFMSKKLRDGFSPSDPAYRTVDSMTTVTQELESLSVNMLNWIRFHYETEKMKPEQFNLHDLVSESAEIASTLAKEKGVELYNDVPEATYIWQYRQALGVIVYNLVMNAVKHTDTGEIRISGLFTADYFSIIVSDTGKGMPTELVDTLNSETSSIPDYSAGEIKKFQFGYPIIKDLLQLVHGTLRVESALNKGTKITIELRVPEGSNDNKS